MAVETSGGTTYAVFTSGDGFRIASSPATNDVWLLDPLVIPYGAGPVPSIQLVLHGSAGYLIANDRVVIAGARLGGNGRWYEWLAPGTGVFGPALLAASSETDLSAVVSASIPGASRPTTQPVAFVGRRAGLRGRGVGRTYPYRSRLGRGGDLADVHIGGDRGHGPEWSTGPGRHLRQWPDVEHGVDRLGTARWTDLGFTTLDQGVVVVGHDDGTAELLMTLDGGHTWSAAG